MWLRVVDIFFARQDVGHIREQLGISLFRPHTWKLCSFPVKIVQSFVSLIAFCLVHVFDIHEIGSHIDIHNDSLL